jgi:hypothetical protein
MQLLDDIVDVLHSLPAFQLKTNRTELLAIHGHFGAERLKLAPKPVPESFERSFALRTHLLFCASDELHCHSLIKLRRHRESGACSREF